MKESEHAELSSANRFERVCHDLKQSIATGLVLTDVAGTDQRQGDARLSVVHEQLEQAAELVQILTDPPTLRGATTDLVAVARSCVVATAAVRAVEMQADDEVPAICADPLSLRRALMNLLDNAVRASVRDGVVRLRIGVDRGVPWLEVSDDGPGFGCIPSGSGHGLEIVRSAVWAAAGRLRIETGPHGGTAVRMMFPLASEVAR